MCEASTARLFSESGTDASVARADHRGSSDVDSVLVAFTFEYSLPSKIAAVSSFTEKCTQLMTDSRCFRANEAEIEIALHEALVNAVVHGNHGDPRKHVHVHCRCEPDEISIMVRDEGQGFDAGRVPDPTAPENIQSSHGRGIYLMRAYMDEVRLEESGRAVHMRKRARSNSDAHQGYCSVEGYKPEEMREFRGRNPRRDNHDKAQTWKQQSWRRPQR